MKSQESYSTLRVHLAPVFKANGFKKAKTMLSWIRPRGELYVSVWCQADQTGWDTYAGPKFVVEFQLGREPVIGKSEIRRARIGKMLSAAEREDIRTIQNSVIASLRRPPKSHALLNPGEKLSAWYLKRFKSIDQPL